MGNWIAWTFAIGGAVAVVASAQYLQFYVLRRWRARVRLPDPVAYTDFPSFRCDEEIVFRIHSSKPVRLRFRRCGPQDFVVIHEVVAAASSQSRNMHRWLGFDWKASVVLAANTLLPGFYRVDLQHQDDPSHRWCMALVVSHRGPQPVVVVASTNTWNAYNDFAGLSNYKDRANPQPLKAIRTFLTYFNIRIRIGERHWIAAVPLPERRPNSRVHRDLADSSGGPSHLAREEAALIRFLERESIAYTVVSDRDFAYSVTSSRMRLVIFNTHSEYWSEEMFGKVDEFIQRGISVAFLSGNNMYRKVQFTATAISVIDRRTPPAQIVPLAGTYYDPYGHLTYDAYRVTDASHWCFEGLAVQEGFEFGEGNANRPAASGYETDKIRSGSNGFRVVAVGKNVEGPAFMVCRDLPGGGLVFSASSVSFAPCIDDDPVIQKLVLNLVRRALAASTGG